MHRSLIATAVVVASLFALGGTALAGGHPPVVTPTPPTPAPVTDATTAAAFAKLYITQNAGTILGQDRRRVRVEDANAVCLQHPIVTTRFGCIFTLRALVIQRGRTWDNWRSASVRGKRGHHPVPVPTPRPRNIRVQRFGCLGALRINGGPGVTPTAQVVFSDCVRASSPTTWPAT